eukprot:171806_1
MEMVLLIYTKNSQADGESDGDGRILFSHKRNARQNLMEMVLNYEENEELGRQIAECEENKTLAKLALQQEYAKELNATLQESNQFVAELDEEVMSQQATINELRQKLQKYESSAADSSVVKMSE